MKISIVLNCDTRAGFQENNSVATEMFKGCVSEDFLTDGLLNKINFFKGFDTEVIIFIDEHLPVPEKSLQYIRTMADIVAVSKHRDSPNFNDKNYYNALSLASGDIVCHVDQDTAMFASSKEAVQELVDLLDNISYVSYPSHWTPNAVHDESFNYRWTSTRFFMCKRDSLDFTEIRKCQSNYEYFIEKYKPSRVCHWSEHILGLIANSSVYYPPINHEKLSIFSWGSYEKYTLRRLNELPYSEIKQWLNSHPIVYPNDIHI